MKKMPRQSPAPASTPPSPGPRIVVIVVTADHVPIARPRSASLKLALIRARLPGTMSAPPTPWAARAAIRSGTLGARPQAREARAKSAIPSPKISRRPKRSPRAPPTRIRAASTIA